MGTTSNTASQHALTITSDGLLHVSDSDGDHSHGPSAVLQEQLSLQRDALLQQLEMAQGVPPPQFNDLQFESMEALISYTDQVIQELEQEERDRIALAERHCIIKEEIAMRTLALEIVAFVERSEEELRSLSLSLLDSRGSLMHMDVAIQSGLMMERNDRLVALQSEFESLKQRIQQDDNNQWREIDALVSLEDQMDRVVVSMRTQLEHLFREYDLHQMGQTIDDQSVHSFTLADRSQVEQFWTVCSAMHLECQYAQRWTEIFVHEFLMPLLHDKRSSIVVTTKCGIKNELVIRIAEDDASAAVPQLFDSTKEALSFFFSHALLSNTARIRAARRCSESILDHFRQRILHSLLDEEMAHVENIDTVINVDKLQTQWKTMHVNLIRDAEIFELWLHDCGFTYTEEEYEESAAHTTLTDYVQNIEHRLLEVYGERVLLWTREQITLDDMVHTEPIAIGDQNKGSIMEFPSCQISQSSHNIMKRARALIRFGRRYDHIVVSMVDLFRTMSSALHQKSIAELPQIAMIFYNSCMYIAHFLLFIDPQKADGESRFIIPSLRMRSFADRIYAQQLQFQRDIMGAYIQDAKLSTLGRHYDHTSRYIDRVVAQIELLSRLYGKVLPQALCKSAIGAMVNNVMSDMITRVLSMKDISADESELLAALCDKLLKPCHRWGLDTMEDSDTNDHLIPSFAQFYHLRNIMNMKSADIADMWESGAYTRAGFSRQQVVHLIHALFNDNEFRKSALSRIEQQSE